MATRIVCNGVQLAVEDSGGGGQTVLFSHGLLYSLRMWDAQVATLRARFRCVAYDHRGQGQSEAPPTGMDMDTLADDVAALIDSLHIAPVHFVGLSMGGFVGMRLAARRPDLVRSLALLDTSAGPEPPGNVPRYRRMEWVARWLGVRPVVGRVLAIMHGESARRDPARAADLGRWREHLLRLDRVAMPRAVEGVLRREAATPLLARIRCPTLVLVGEEDTATVPARAEEIAEGIAGARLVRIPRAGHMSPIDAPEAVTAELRAFLEAQPYFFP
ncbi:MAG TPA: alpha/beta fold hydrolase [Myxococcaceae bacterium]|nr:alpha/beta fold hydrolase [Myxococcaceae bacterium]